MDFGRPNVEIGWKMANGRLLFLALHNKANAGVYGQTIYVYVENIQLLPSKPSFTVKHLLLY